MDRSKSVAASLSTARRAPMLLASRSSLLATGPNTSPEVVRKSTPAGVLRQNGFRKTFLRRGLAVEPDVNRAGEVHMEQATNPLNSMDAAFLLQQRPPNDSVTGDTFSRELLSAMYSFRDGNFAVRLPHDLTGVEGKIADAFNDIVTLAQRRARETGRVSHVVGREGKLKQRM